MSKKILLTIKNPRAVYQELALAPSPYRGNPTGSILFIVEGTLIKPRVGIRYPGYKLRRRTLKKPNKNSALWANLLDFEVIPFEGGKQNTSALFTYQNLLQDFYRYKKDSNVFWALIQEVHKHNVVGKNLPQLKGINPRRFLEMLKWMWIQEDLNYFELRN